MREKEEEVENRIEPERREKEECNERKRGKQGERESSEQRFIRGLPPRRERAAGHRE